MRIIALSLILLVPTATAAASPYDVSAEGLSAFRQLAEAQGHETRTIVTDLELTTWAHEPARTLLVLSRTQPTPQRELDAVADFLDAGGSLLIASQEDSTYALTGPRGVRVLPTIVLSPQTPTPLHQPNGTFGVVAAQDASPLRLLDGFDGDVLLSTGPDAYLSLGNRTITGDNEAAAFPIACALEHPGGGHVFVLGDASILANTFLENTTLDNRRFANTLLDDALPEPGLVVFDLERPQLGAAGHMSQATVEASLRAPWFVLLLVAPLFVAVAVAAFRAAPRRHTATEDLRPRIVSERTTNPPGEQP